MIAACGAVRRALGRGLLERKEYGRSTMTPIGNGFLQHRAFAVVIAVGCSYGAVGSWLSISRHTTFPRNPISICALLFAIFISASLTYRSRFVGERVVFGGASAALVLAGITTLSFAPSTMSVIVTAKSVLWTVSAVASAIILVRGLITPRLGRA